MAVPKLEVLFCLAIFVIGQSNCQSLKTVPDDELLKNVTLKRVSLNKTMLECTELTHVNPNYILRIRAGKWQHNDDALKQWALCLLVKSQLMSRNGVFKMDNALKLIPREDMVATIKKINYCLPSTRAAPRVIAWKYLKCYNAKKPKELVVL